MRRNEHDEFMLEIGDSFEYSSTVSIRMQSRNKGKDKKRSISLLTPFLLPRLMYDCMQISYLTKTSTKIRPGAKFEMNINLLGI